MFWYVCLPACAWMMRLKRHYHRGNDFPSSLDIVILESIWNRGHNGGNGQHDVKTIEEMGEDCCTGDLCINICKCVAVPFDLLSKTLTFYVMLQIKWENRLDERMVGHHYFTSLDGTDFHIQEPSVFDPMWYSHKFEGPGVCYDVGILLVNWVDCLVEWSISLCRVS